MRTTNAIAILNASNRLPFSIDKGNDQTFKEISNKTNPRKGDPCFTNIAHNCN